MKVCIQQRQCSRQFNCLNTAMPSEACVAFASWRRTFCPQQCQVGERFCLGGKCVTTSAGQGPLTAMPSGGCVCVAVQMAIEHQCTLGPNAQKWQWQVTCKYFLADGNWPAKLAEQGPSEDLTALAAAAALSVRSTHPISQAITGCVNRLGSAFPQMHVDDFRQEPGIVLPLSC